MVGLAFPCTYLMIRVSAVYGALLRDCHMCHNHIQSKQGGTRMWEKTNSKNSLIIHILNLNSLLLFEISRKYIEKCCPAWVWFVVDKKKMLETLVNNMADDGLTPCDTLPFVTTILTVRYKQVIVTTRAPSASINDRKLYLIVNYTNESKLQQFGTIFLLENGFKMSFVTILSRSQCVEIFTNCKPPLFSLSPLTESYQLFLHIPLRWRHNVSRLFTQSFILTQIKENIKAPRHWSLCGQFTGDRWIPRAKGQLRRKCFHLMTSACDDLSNKPLNGWCFLNPGCLVLSTHHYCWNIAVMKP